MKAIAEEYQELQNKINKLENKSREQEQTLKNYRAFLNVILEKEGIIFIPIDKFKSLQASKFIIVQLNDKSGFKLYFNDERK